MAKGFDQSVPNKRLSVCSSRVSQNRVNTCAITETDINSNRSEAENCSSTDSINRIDTNGDSNAINVNLISNYPSLTIMPTIRSYPTLDETEAVARELFTQFAREQSSQFASEHSTDESIISQSEIEEQLQQFSTNGYSIATPVMASVGRDLRRISESFAQSVEREQVRVRASSVNITSLTNEQFALLLDELFLHGNITRERIVVLFFFCSDLAVQALASGRIGYFKRLIEWSLSYIIDKVCSWVQRQGGWEVVLGSYFPRAAITACALLGCLAFGIYIRRNMF